MPVKPITVVLSIRNPKKHSVRFDTDKADSPVSSFYIANEADADLGHPKAIKLTISPVEIKPEEPKEGGK